MHGSRSREKYATFCHHFWFMAVGNKTQAERVNNIQISFTSSKEGDRLWSV
jgi:hypothetical protein